MLQVENLVKKYGNHTAVDDLSFTVEKGQIYGFLGPNGAGKSTTMNIMTGYIAASSGTVTINGYDILKEPVKAKQCSGYLPELPPLYTDMTVWEYLMFVAELKKIPRDVRVGNVEAIIGKMQLDDVEERLIKNLSKGYKQRVGLAQALIGYPEVIILDEPMVGLDPKQIIEMRDLIKSLSEEHTVILSSHILSEISAVCDHVFIISKGKLVASDATENLVSLMSGAQEIEVTVRTDVANAQKELAAISEISKVEVKNEDAGELVVYAKKGADVREDVFRILAEKHFAVLEMHTIEKSLEDVFLEITQEGEEK